MERALSIARENRQTYLDQLIAFLSIPSVSTDPAYKDAVTKAARWLADRLRDAGLENVQLFDLGGHPLVYADWLHAGADAPTVLVYGHYDVQPAEPLALWQSPPFEPSILNDYIYARGASDDKGQLYVHVKAVEALLKAEGRLPVNIKFVVEGEEESGGDTLTAFIPQNRELLAANVAVVSDTTMMRPDLPAIVYGLRGNVYTFLDIKGAKRDLHSGSYGGAINNPINVMAHIIAQLKDANGRVLIPGFYDKVKPMSAEERALLNQVPFDEASWLAETGAPASWGESEFTIRERIGVRPTLDVNGIIGGYTGDGRKTVLPASAHAKISMRLVPDQDSQEIAHLYTDFIKRLAPASVNVEVTICSTSAPSVSELDSPAMRAASDALENAFGSKPVFIREGGSIPVVAQFQEMLGLETVMMGFGLADDRIHAPNERFYLPNFYRGIEAAIRFLDKLGRAT